MSLFSFIFILVVISIGKSIILSGTESFIIDDTSSRIITITMRIDTSSNVLITLVGPHQDWYGVTFNANRMNDQQYAIVVGGDGVFNNRRTRQYGLNTVNIQQCTALMNTVNGETRTVDLECTLTGEYTFPTTPVTLPILFAGTKTGDAKSCCSTSHSGAFGRRGSSFIVLAEVNGIETNMPSITPTNTPTSMPTITPTPKPTNNPLGINETAPPTNNPSYFPSITPSKTPTNIPTYVPSITPSLAPILPNTQCEKDTFGIELQEINSSPKFEVGITIDCVFNRVTFIMSGPSVDNWFGIVFGTSMASPEGNFAIVYTTGKSGNLIEECHVYSLTDTNGAGVNRVNSLITTDSNTINSDMRTVHCSMNLDDTYGEFSLTTTEVTFGYAIGGSLRLGFHSVFFSLNFNTFNLQTGETSSNNVTELFIFHGILMWLSWSLFGYFGIFFSRNRYLLNGAGWFRVHKMCQILCVLLQLSGLGIMMVARTKTGKSLLPRSNDIHELAGFIIIIFAVLQPINALFRGHPNERTKQRIIWEYLHKSLGYLCLIFAQIVVVFGILKMNNNVLAYCQIGYIIIILIIFIGFTIYGSYFRDDTSNENNTKSVQKLSKHNSIGESKRNKNGETDDEYL